MFAHFLASLLHFLLVTILGLFGLSLDNANTDKDAQEAETVISRLEYVEPLPVAYVTPVATVTVSSKCSGVSLHKIHTVKTPLLIEKTDYKLIS